MVKAFEIVIMAVAALGFALQHMGILLAALFMMGMHSTFFAPVKYGLLPQVLHDTELVGGNALIQMGTFVAILLGTLVRRPAGGTRARWHHQHHPGRDRNARDS